ncbi:MAG: 16S rRNA (uracil(1498)-N(3))-methyltransferase [Lachnospiraceae bacterium]|nr:16S rRNA (uracil(1498)-N(3))-methyltransferase [Lachnospiraceae bacterium]
MYQFFVPPENIQDSRIVITGEDVNHIKNVLRMKVGEEIAVSNGSDGREYRCGIEEIGEEIVCSLRFIKEDGVELPSRITLFQGLPKADKMELIIQKAVELGAYEIVPVSMVRSVVKLDEKKKHSRITRWQAISEAAAKQSKRSLIPQIRDVMTMRQAIEYAKKMDILFIPYELAEDMSKTRELFSSIKPGKHIGFFIGPEGGFDKSEIQYALEAGVKPVTLGKRILRTETAGMAVLSILMYQLEGKNIQ